MPNYTPNYNLEQPFQEEYYNVDVQNQNMEKIDAALRELKTQNSGVGRSMAGQTVEPEKGQTVTAKEGAEIFNAYMARSFDASDCPVGNVASGVYSHAEGLHTTADGDAAHAEGHLTRASGICSHAEGSQSIASGLNSHAEGHSTASNEFSHAEGNHTVASGLNSHAEGVWTKAAGDGGAHAEGGWCEANGECSHAEGSATVANGECSHAGGTGTIANANGQTVIGWTNIPSSLPTDKFIIGKGSYRTTPAVTANCFRATDTGTYASGNYNASGADYAELFEWADGNPDGEDRAGRFVTLEGEKIRLATPEDEYIVGIVSGNPSVVGDVYDDQWQGMYLSDVFGRPVWEEVEVPDRIGPDGGVLLPAHVERRQKINPAYNSGESYVPRSQRPEWDAVGLLGKLVAVDDGSCRVNGWCAVGGGGIAFHSDTRTRYRVMDRLDNTHIRILVL